jgi:hypothetical protein
MLGKEHPSPPTSANNLALVLRDRGKYKQGEEMYRQDPGRVRQFLGQDHPFALTSTSNLANVLKDQGLASTRVE